MQIAIEGEVTAVCATCDRVKFGLDWKNIIANLEQQKVKGKVFCLVCEANSQACPVLWTCEIASPGCRTEKSFLTCSIFKEERDEKKQP